MGEDPKLVHERVRQILRVAERCTDFQAPSMGAFVEEQADTLAFFIASLSNRSRLACRVLLRHKAPPGSIPGHASRVRVDSMTIMRHGEGAIPVPCGK